MNQLTNADALFTLKSKFRERGLPKITMDIFEGLSQTVLGQFLLIKQMHDQYLEALQSKWNMSKIEVQILLFLYTHPDLNTATAIIGSRHFSKSYVSTALKDLEKNGFIVRYYSGSNHKTIFLSLTSAAMEMAREGQRVESRFIEHLMNGIDPKELEHIQEVIDKMTNNAAFRLEEMKGRRQAG